MSKLPPAPIAPPKGPRTHRVEVVTVVKPAAVGKSTATIPPVGVLTRQTPPADTDPAERRRFGDVMGKKYDWSGDEEIGLTRDAWVYECPLFAVGFDGEPVSG